MTARIVYHEDRKPYEFSNEEVQYGMQGTWWPGKYGQLWERISEAKVRGEVYPIGLAEAFEAVMLKDERYPENICDVIHSLTRG